MALGSTPAVLVCALWTAAALADGGQRLGRSDLPCSRLDELKRPRHGDFGYEGEHGPEHWPSTFPECGGSAQSPLDIQMAWTQYMELPAPLEVPVFNWEPSKVQLVNNGHSVQLSVDDASSTAGSVLYGGPLEGKYTLSNIHFHWGKQDSQGSEHAVNGKYYAMEMHMVFMKQRRGASFREHGDAAVVAVFLEVSDKDNDDLEPVVASLPGLVEVNAVAQPDRRLSTEGLLPRQRGLLMYNGSLTTPPCSEVVTWLIFQQPITVSSRQVEAFRKLKSPFGTLSHNTRPVQAVNGRDLYRSTTERSPEEPRFSRSALQSGLNGTTALYLLSTLLLLHVSC